MQRHAASCPWMQPLQASVMRCLQNLGMIGAASSTSRSLAPLQMIAPHDRCRHSPPKLEAWVAQYAQRRYGADAPPSVASAWQTLVATVYSCLDGTVDHVRHTPKMACTSSPSLLLLHLPGSAAAGRAAAPQVFIFSIKAIQPPIAVSLCGTQSFVRLSSLQPALAILPSSCISKCPPQLGHRCVTSRCLGLGWRRGRWGCGACAPTCGTTLRLWREPGASCWTARLCSMADPPTCTTSQTSDARCCSRGSVF